MSEPVLQFVVNVRRVVLVDEDEAPVKRENTILRFCDAFCHEMMPHYVQVDTLICACCLNKVLKGAS